ncbi:MAG: 5'-methylthioadenosine/adenosylhomocysteine nucleosidase [Mogibacterium sp.]|nr:5'-methylthioadenosine/adenosylhomocysteine nucleosidase [Mogibacterium sp.]
MKRIIALLLIAAVSSMLCACGGRMQKARDAMEDKEYIGLISAMDNEIDMLIDEADIDHVDTIGGVEYHVGTLCGQNVVIAKSGIGMVLSASVATTLLNGHKVSKVIFTGIAGGTGDKTKVLDEVIGDRYVEHDYGTVTDEGFKWTYGNTGEEVGDKGYFYSDPELADLAYESAVDVVGKDNVHRGTIASGNQFITSGDYADRLEQDFEAIACEMEGAAIAEVCTQYKTPFVVIRAMSDKADGKAHESFDNFGDTAADNSSRIVMEMLNNM